MITNRTKYGLKALLSLTKSGGETGLHPNDIAAGGTIPEDAILPILESLDAGGFVRGTEDTFHLARPAEEIMVGQVVRHLDGPLAPIPCVSQTAYKRCLDCGNEAGCEVRRVMRLVRDATAHILDNTSLVDMGAGRDPKAVSDELADKLTS